MIHGGGDAGELLRSIDWRATRLGAIESWPQSLRTALNMSVNSRFPIAIYWGPDFVMLYNDSLLPMVGANKHPQAMAKPAFEVLPEIRGIIEPLLEHVRATGEATWSEDLMLPLVRGAAPEESYFTFTYSPIHDDAGAVGGVFCAVIETTAKVIEGRRLRLLNSLAQAAHEKTKEEACARAADEVGRFPEDVPFALLYLCDEAGEAATLVGSANITPGSAFAPTYLTVATASPRPFAPSDASGTPRMIALADGPSGARGAIVLPIERAGGGRPFGFLVAGLSTMLAASPSYERFHNLLGSSLSQAVANAAAYEEERKRAEALADLDRAKTQFFSNVSHEFRTPLTLIMASVQDLLASEGTAERHTLELLDRNAMRLLKLVNTMLEFSRIEAGRVEAVYEPTDLSAVTNELASGFRSAIERAGLTFVVDCPPLSESIYVDRDMWEKIVLNLLSNAFKFTFTGSITVRMRLQEDGAYLFVEDTGIGVAEHEQPRLFERFHQIEGARARSHEGSGIGLALIHELVRQHGGGISVSSQLGMGTTFRVRIPLGMAHLPSSRVHAARALPSTAIAAEAFVAEASRWSAPARTQMKILGAAIGERIVFADDNADMRDYVVRLLGERWTVEAFADGSAALDRVRALPPQLVLSDVMMPSLDGFALVTAMRAEPRLKAVPIILLSARASEEEAAMGLASGATDYIAKPFSARDLLVRVASALSSARAARDLAELEERQRANIYRHFMQAPFPVAVFKGTSHIVELANAKALTAWGKGSQVIGLPIAVAIPELRDQPFVGYLDRVLATGIAHEGREHAAVLPTGANGALEQVYFNFVYAPLRDPQGAIEGVLLSAFDVTTQVEARLERERALAQLKLVTEERELALREARNANLAKDEFLATMSHELRTPLNAIVGWANLLNSGNVSGDRVPKALETIERNARIQARLIEDMLDIARIEQGKLVLTVGPTDLTRVVEAALEAVRPAANLKGIRLQPLLDFKSIIVGDADRLQQVAWNLLSNAIKFTPKGGRVQIQVRREHSHVEMVVADDGQGIDPAFLPMVFERFRQADGKITRKSGGLGLGLAIVRSVVELHGGTIEAESAGPNRGSTFRVRLPTAPFRSNAPAPATSNTDEPTPTPNFERPATLSGKRALVVDDELETRDLLQYVLEDGGMLVATASDAEQALRSIHEHSFDVLISDVGMPDVDGYTLIRRIRQLPEAGASIPAIALTAYARGEDRTAALRAGFDSHLTKPCQPEELLVVVARLIESARSRRR